MIFSLNLRLEESNLGRTGGGRVAVQIEVITPQDCQNLGLPH